MKTCSKYRLFTTRRFLPIFIAQFLGAFNDNLLRSGLVVLIAYAGSNGVQLAFRPEIMVTLCSALLVVPFIIFSSIAGPLADKLEKARLVTLTKIAEVLIMLGAFYGFATHNIYLLMVMLFISGTHSTFFGPVKLSILPEHLSRGELLAGNGFISGSTYIGILSGMIAGGLLAIQPYNAIGFMAVGVAVVGVLASLLIPRTRAAAPDTVISFNIIRGTVDMMRVVRQSRSMFLAVLGLSWFLLVGSVFMAQFPNYARGVVHADNEVYTLFLTIFSVGIALGAVLCDRLLKGEISTRYAPAALLGMSFFTCMMVFSTPAPAHEGLTGIVEFIRNEAHWLMLFSMLMVAVCGGIYMVPLYAVLQHLSDEKLRSRVMAASNMCDSVFMTLAAIVCALILLLPFAGITDIFLLVSALNLWVFWYAKRHAPELVPAAA